MKKVSTVGTKATKNFSQHKLTIGLDLGDRVATACWTKWGKCTTGFKGGTRKVLFRVQLCYHLAPHKRDSVTPSSY